MPWVVAGAGVAAAGSIGSGLIGASASQKAAQQQAQAEQQATAAELGMYDQTVAREQPFVTAGTNALSGLTSLLGLGSPGGPSSPILAMLGLAPGGTPGQVNPAAFYGSPGYQFQLQQGTNAVTNSAAANGGLGGNALAALQAKGQGLANANFSNYIGQSSQAWQQLLNQLSGLAGAGQSAATNLGGIGTQVAGQQGNNIVGGGNAIASGTMGSTNALTGGINQGLGNLATLFNTPQGKVALNNLFNTGGGGGGGSDSAAVPPMFT